MPNMSIENKEKLEALEQLKLIQKVITASNTLTFSGKRLITVGILLILTPGIQFILTKTLWKISYFNANSGSAGYNTGLVINILIYFVLFKLLTYSYCSEEKRNRSRSAMNPTLKRLFDIHEVIIWTMVAIIIAEACFGQAYYILPMVFIFIGLLFNLFGRLTVKSVLVFSYSYIIIGVIYLCLTYHYIQFTWIIGLIYLGISYIFMGIKLNQKSREISHAE